MRKGYNFEKPVPIIGRGFSWCPYKNEDFLAAERFSIDQWHRIIYDIDSMSQWAEFLKKYNKVCNCYALYPENEREPIAMCYILAEDGLYDDGNYGEIVSLHGGGWKTDLRCKWLYARAWMRMVQHLHTLGCKVLTNVKNDNNSAKHLVEGTGFRMNELGLYEYHSEYNRFRHLGL